MDGLEYLAYLEAFMFAFIGFLLDFILIGFRRVNNRYLARGLPDRFPQNFFSIIALSLIHSQELISSAKRRQRSAAFNILKKFWIKTSKKNSAHRFSYLTIREYCAFAEKYSQPKNEPKP